MGGASRVAGVDEASNAVEAGGRTAPMIRWLGVVLLALLIFNAAGPWLEKLGLGRLPGDFRFRFVGRDWQVPLTSTALLSLLAYGIGRLV